jgi:hypothetical protein
MLINLIFTHFYIFFFNEYYYKFADSHLQLIYLKYSMKNYIHLHRIIFNYLVSNIQIR